MARRAVFAAALSAAIAAIAAIAVGDLPDLQKRGSLKVLVFRDEDPEMFSFQSTGEPGFEREILEGFARLQRLRLEVVQVGKWGDMIPSLNRGDRDLVSGILDTESRRMLLDFTVKYFGHSALEVLGRAGRESPGGPSR